MQSKISLNNNYLKKYTKKDLMNNIIHLGPKINNSIYDNLIIKKNFN